jgi:hypothetical protein
VNIIYSRCIEIQMFAMQSLISTFEGISLIGLEETKAQLMTRVESKHLMTLSQCKNLVQALADSYRVLEIQDTRIGRYETMYYDTLSFLSYNQHHNGKSNRFKLRLRHYNTSGDTFLEVKKKDNKGSTEKKRMKTTWSSAGFLPEQVEFLRSALPYDCQTFHPVIRTIYNRLTLVSTKSPERITFDMGISFDDGQHVISYPDLVIGEIKYEKGIKNSPALQAIHAMGIKKRSFSKYCIGVSLLYDWLKHNRFKENLLYLARITDGGGISC